MVTIRILRKTTRRKIRAKKNKSNSTIIDIATPIYCTMQRTNSQINSWSYVPSHKATTHRKFGMWFYTPSDSATLSISVNEVQTRFKWIRDNLYSHINDVHYDCVMRDNRTNIYMTVDGTEVSDQQYEQALFDRYGSELEINKFHNPE